MARTKLTKFKELQTFPNVYPTNSNLNWNQDIFKNNNPLILELGCGKAKFSLQMAQHFPHINFIALDRKGERLWRAATDAQALKLQNLIFIQGNAYYLAKEFPAHSLQEIWLTFPDPLPRKNQANKRLTNQKFLQIYKQLLTPQGTLNLKTDSLDLINYSEQEILALSETISGKSPEKTTGESTGKTVGKSDQKIPGKTTGKTTGKILYKSIDIYSPTATPLSEHIYFKTDFENKFLTQGLPIHYLQATL